MADRGICEANPPAAHLATPTTVRSGETGQLDGSASTSPHGTPLTYRWTQIGGPAVDLADATAAQPRFVAPAVDVPTRVGFQLVVNDGVSNSAPVTGSFTLIPAPLSMDSSLVFG